MIKLIKLFHKTKKAERLTNGKEVQPIKTWCGRQELKTPIHLKNPLFIRHSYTERQSGRQKFLKKQIKFLLISNIHPTKIFTRFYYLVLLGFYLVFNFFKNSTLYSKSLNNKHNILYSLYS